MLVMVRSGKVPDHIGCAAKVQNFGDSHTLFPKILALWTPHPSLFVGIMPVAGAVWGLRRQPGRLLFKASGLPVVAGTVCGPCGYEFMVRSSSSLSRVRSICWVMKSMASSELRSPR